MSHKTTAALIRRSRLEKGLTQSALAERIHVSAKAVSKWERGAGMPDAAIVPLLSAELGLSAEALLAGHAQQNPPDGGNMKRIRFFICPQCRSLMTATGNPDISCCGRRLEPLTVQTADDEHRLVITDVEDEKLVSWQHPMEKAHHLTCLAAVGYDCVHMVRLYPEGAQEHRLPRIPWARYFCICSDQPGVLLESRPGQRR